MTLKQCKECNKDVGGKVKKCPHCGTDQRGFFKKHPILTVFGGLFLFGIVTNAINPKTQNQTSSTSSEQFNSTPTEQIKEFKIGDSVSVGSFSYRINNAKFVKTIGNQFSKTTADGEFLLVSMDIVNQDKEPHLIANGLFSILDNNGVKYETSSEAGTALMMSGAKSLMLKNCQPGIQTSGVIAFEVPNQNVKYKIQLTGGFLSGSKAEVSIN